MKRQNLSRMAIFGVLTAIIDGVRQYWGGHHNGWINDPNDSRVLVLSDSQLSDYRFQLRYSHGINATVEERDWSFRILMLPDRTWVVIHPLGHAHRVFLANVYGDGWYIKNEGSIEKELVIHRTKQSWDHVKFRGDKIASVELHTPHFVLANDGDFHVPTDSNLLFQFEYEPEPYVAKVAATAE